ncbi:hypothetical protein FEO85_13700 [Stenotrophomonas maltophilia]|nr:hypothetical protein FEO85_13700 [Stenotrophomonas maltophilia]
MKAPFVKLAPPPNDAASGAIWLTITASFAAWPAATLTIRRRKLLSPTETVFAPPSVEPWPKETAFWEDASPPIAIVRAPVA